MEGPLLIAMQSLAIGEERLAGHIVPVKNRPRLKPGFTVVTGRTYSFRMVGKAGKIKAGLTPAILRVSSVCFTPNLSKEKKKLGTDSLSNRL